MNTITGKLARAVRKVDNDTRRINHYPADNAVSFVSFVSTYSLDIPVG